MESTATESEESEVKNTFPKKIHIIWIGGSIPEEYLKFINQVSIIGLKSDFKVNVWVNKDSNITKTAEKSAISIKHIGLRNISEVMNNNLKDKIGEEYNKDFNKYLQLEMSGSMKNLAAAADLLRYAILIKEGGMYLDADTKLSANWWQYGQKGKNLKEQTDLSKEILDASINRFGFATTQQYKGYEGSGWTGGNDMLACTPDNKIMIYVLKECIDGYKKNENTESDYYITTGIGSENEKNIKVKLSAYSAQRNITVLRDNETESSLRDSFELCPKLAPMLEHLVRARCCFSTLSTLQDNKLKV
jgi:hypothetical protein